MGTLAKQTDSSDSGERLNPVKDHTPVLCLTAMFACLMVAMYFTRENATLASGMINVAMGIVGGAAGMAVGKVQQQPAPKVDKTEELPKP